MKKLKRSLRRIDLHYNIQMREIQNCLLMLTSVSTFIYLIPVKVTGATHADLNMIPFQYCAQHMGAPFPPQIFELGL